MIYLDSSALMKLIRTENETAALSDWLSQRPGHAVVSGELGRVEVFKGGASGWGSCPDRSPCGDR